MLYNFFLLIRVINTDRLNKWIHQAIEYYEISYWDKLNKVEPIIHSRCITQHKNINYQPKVILTLVSMKLPRLHHWKLCYAITYLLSISYGLQVGTYVGRDGRIDNTPTARCDGGEWRDAADTGRWVRRLLAMCAALWRASQAPGRVAREWRWQTVWRQSGALPCPTR